MLKPLSFSYSPLVHIHTNSINKSHWQTTKIDPAMHNNLRHRCRFVHATQIATVVLIKLSEATAEGDTFLTCLNSRVRHRNKRSLEFGSLVLTPTRPSADSCGYGSGSSRGRHFGAGLEHPRILRIHRRLSHNHQS